MLSDTKKVHFIGIGGVGMSAVAKLLRDSGITVTGSDESVYPPVSGLLAKASIPYREGYAPEHIPTDVDLIVIGKNAKLVPETNAEVAAAIASGIPIRSFPEILGELSSGKETVVIAGSYGKSSLSALLSHCLVSAGLEPSFFIGAAPLSPDTNAAMGAGPLFVMEGDEYPSSNTDMRSKFLHMHPSHILITPLAHDHLNVFPTKEYYLKPFYELTNLLPENGTMIVCLDGALSKEFISNIKRSFVSYGLTSGDFYASDIVWGERTAFTIMRGETPLTRVETSQLGEHNIENIVGAAAFLFSRNLVSPAQFAPAVASFRGIVRRLDCKSDRTTVPIYEGFGSSYEKARSAMAAMKRHFPDRRLLVVFEPHTFSWRNRNALPWYDTVFAGAARAYVFAPEGQGAATHEQVTQDEIVGRIRQSGIDAIPVNDTAQTLSTLERDMKQDDVVLLLSSGPLGGIIEPLVSFAEKKFPR